jgi:Bacteriophage T4-like portal protein (Gp20)
LEKNSVAIKLFGFEINRKKSEQEDERNKTFTLPQNDDGAVTIQSGAYYGTYVDLDGVVRNEIELITRYREMAMQPEIEGAIDDIVNEAIVNDDKGNGVEINTDELKESNPVKKKIRDEFEYILKLLNFGNMGHDIFRRWYIDGRLFYHIVINEKSPQKGITEIKYIDPRRIRKVREVQKTKDTETGMEIIKRMNEYYLYNERGVIGAHSNLGTKIAVDSVVNVNSGLMDSKRAMVLSYLHKAIKPLNQLRMVEDATVIYRLSRAPERRVFYVDVGNMPTIKAEQYLRDVMVKYRNKLVYDSTTGEIKDDRKHLSMLEDFWLPRREGGKGTEITTLPGGQNLGELEDVKYFEKKLYKSLGVPLSRLEPAQGFSLGRTTEITREELKFGKFVNRLRNKFSILFDDILRVQLVLKKVCTEEEWNEFKENIYYDFMKDNNFTELKEAELLLNRMGVLQMVDPYVGRYYSKEWVRRNVLMMDDEEIEEIDGQIANEQAATAPVDEQGNPLEAQAQAPAGAATPNIVPPTPQEAMMQQYMAQQGVPQEQMPMQDGTGKNQMDPLDMGVEADQARNRQRFVNDTMEPAR